MATKKNRSAVALGKLRAKNGDMAEIGKRGGKTRGKQLSEERKKRIASGGGTARAAKLTPEQRSEIARKAGLARHGKKP